MSKNSIKELILNEMAHVLQVSVCIPLALSICDKQIKKEKLRAS